VDRAVTSKTKDNTSSCSEVTKRAWAKIGQKLSRVFFQFQVIFTLIYQSYSAPGGYQTSGTIRLAPLAVLTHQDALLSSPAVSKTTDVDTDVESSALLSGLLRVTLQYLAYLRGVSEQQANLYVYTGGLQLAAVPKAAPSFIGGFFYLLEH